MTVCRCHLTTGRVRGLVERWYLALDEHRDPGELAELLAHAGLVLKFPGRVVHGGAEFTEWYDEVTTTYFDESRVVERIAVRLTSPLHAEVTTRINWQARMWEPPSARSRWVGYHWTEELSVVVQDDAPRIRTCTVTAPVPMRGSPRLALLE